MRLLEITFTDAHAYRAFAARFAATAAAAAALAGLAIDPVAAPLGQVEVDQVEAAGCAAA